MANTPLLGSFSDVGGSSLMFRNALINGNFDIWQRGTSQTSNGFGSADRWSSQHVGVTKTTSRQSFTLGQTDVPNNPTYFCRTVVTNVVGSTNYALLLQRVEGVSRFAGQTATLSFWAKADSSKNIAVEFCQGFGTGGTPSADVVGINVTTISLTSTWQKFTVLVNFPNITGKVLGSNADDWLQIIFWLNAGSNFNSRTNSLGQQSGTFDIAQVQLEAGPVATPFEQRPIGLELSLCQRYYQEYKFINGGPMGFADSSTNSQHVWMFQVPLRTGVPAAKCGNSGSFECRRGGIVASSVTSVAFDTNTTTQSVRIGVNSSSLTIGQAVQLASSNSGVEVKLTVDAEF